MKKLKHYVSMIKKNFKKYSFLSITIAMSFTFLFLYVAVTDSNTYNEYKEVFGTSDKISLVFGDSDDQNARKKMQQLTKCLTVKDHYYAYYEQQQVLNQYGNVNAQIQFIPNSIWAHYVYSDSFIQPVKFSNDNIKLKNNEVIVEQNLYKYLKAKNDMTISIPISISQQNKVVKKFNVVGYCDAGSDRLTEEEGNLTGYTYIFLSQDIVKENIMSGENINARMLIYSEKNSELNVNAQKLGLNLFSVYNYKMQAIQDVKKDIKNKMVLLIILYIIFGINLYSSFKNTLSERKYEIGVKRAIGAGKLEIIKQFFFEGFTITIGNIIVSIWLGLTILLAYKEYLNVVVHSTWIIYISKYSISMFLIISIFLSVFYSVIFAYRSTKVDVLENLRNE